MYAHRLLISTINIFYLLSKGVGFYIDVARAGERTGAN